MYLLDSTCSPSMLLALQYTCWPLSSGTPVYCSTETVLYKSLASCCIEVVIWVKISAFSLYQVMFAAGLTGSFVLQVMVMDLDALTAVWGVDNVSVETGTVGINNCFTSFQHLQLLINRMKIFILCFWNWKDNSFFLIVLSISLQYYSYQIITSRKINMYIFIFCVVKWYFQRL